MNQIATTIEQSKKLIELGLSADTTDMYYYNNDEIPQVISDIKSLKENINPKFYTLAWSLSALIELIPNKISISDDLYYVCYKRNSAELRGPITWDGHQKTKLFKADNTIDATFEMVCYLLENKLIK